MDDSNASTNDPNINPDVITAQSDIPALVLNTRPIIPMTNSGIIDITPGAPEAPVVPRGSQHIDTAPFAPENKILDITPEGPIFVDLSDVSTSDNSTPVSKSVELTPPPVFLESAAPSEPVPPEESPAQNPLYEDPDTVKIIK